MAAESARCRGRGERGEKGANVDRRVGGAGGRGRRSRGQKGREVGAERRSNAGPAALGCSGSERRWRRARGRRSRSETSRLDALRDRAAPTPRTDRPTTRPGACLLRGMHEKAVDQGFRSVASAVREGMRHPRCREGPGRRSVSVVARRKFLRLPPAGSRQRDRATATVFDPRSTHCSESGAPCESSRETR
jgi:hypothetical protein